MREYEEYERAEEFKELGNHAAACLQAVLDHSGADNVVQLARHVYKYTDCGAQLGVLLYRGENNPGQWVYRMEDIAIGDFITALSISSIVEGVEQTTQTQIIDLFADEYETLEQCANAYSTALQAVEDEAAEIWNATHGCSTCAEHWHQTVSLDCDGDDGVTPVWKNCPDCQGYGSCI